MFVWKNRNVNYKVGQEHIDFFRDELINKLGIFMTEWLKKDRKTRRRLDLSKTGFGAGLLAL